MEGWVGLEYEVFKKGVLKYFNNFMYVLIFRREILHPSSVDATNKLYESAFCLQQSKKHVSGAEFTNFFTTSHKTIAC